MKDLALSKTGVVKSISKALLMDSRDLSCKVFQEAATLPLLYPSPAGLEGCLSSGDSFCL